jgi:hypothetical protein
MGIIPHARLALELHLWPRAYVFSDLSNANGLAQLHRLGSPPLTLSMPL